MISIPASINVRAAAARALFAALIVAFGLAATACQAPKEPLRVGILAWPPYDMVPLALGEKLLDPQDYELEEFQTPSEMVRSFRYGLIDVMLVTSHFAVSTLDELEDTRIIYVVDVSLGGDALLARPHIDSAEALRGRRVGVEVAPLGMYTLLRALDDLGLERHAIEIVNVDTADQLEAWHGDEVDAVVTYEPTRSKLKSLGAVELFNSRSIPYEILDVIVVQADLIDSRRQALVAFLQGFDRALQLYRRNPDETVPALARRHAMSDDAYRRAMAGVEVLGLSANLELLTGDGKTIMEALERQREVMLEAGMLTSAPDLDPLIDASIVEQAAGQ